MTDPPMVQLWEAIASDGVDPRARLQHVEACLEQLSPGQRAQWALSVGPSLPLPACWEPSVCNRLANVLCTLSRLAQRHWLSPCSVSAFARHVAQRMRACPPTSLDPCAPSVQWLRVTCDTCIARGPTTAYPGPASATQGPPRAEGRGHGVLAALKGRRLPRAETPSHVRHWVASCAWVSRAHVHEGAEKQRQQHEDGKAEATGAMPDQEHDQQCVHDTTAPLSPNVVARLRQCHEALVTASSQASLSQASADVGPLVEALEDHGPAMVFATIPATALSDDRVRAVCRDYVNPDVSVRRCVELAQGLLLPRLQALSQPASRVLFDAVMHVARHHVHAVAQGLFVPLMTATAVFHTYQADILHRVVRDVFDPEQALHLVEAFVTQCAPGAHWSDHTATTLMNVLVVADATAFGDSTTKWLDALLPLLEHQCTHLALQKSMKFSKLLFKLVTKVAPAVMRPHVERMRAVLAKCDTFMARSALKKLPTT